jgi:hypothetical protein
VSKTRRLGTSIRWDEIPHAEIRAKIYARIGRNAVVRSADDSLLHILHRQLRNHDNEDHRRFIELKARDIIEHLRCIRDAYQEYVDKHNCQPVLEAYWVVLRFAVFPTAIQVLQQAVIDYLRQTRVCARDLSLLFGIPTHTCYRDYSGSGRKALKSLYPPNLDDDSPPTDDELEAVAKLVNSDTLLWFRDIHEGGAVGHPLGEGIFSLDDPISIRRSWSLYAMSKDVTPAEWANIREKLWYMGAPWTQGLSILFGCVQDELLSQWRALPPDSLAHLQKSNNDLSTLAKVVIPQKASARIPGRPKSKVVSDRNDVIRRVATRGVRGASYCSELDRVGLCTPVEWQKRDGCPKKYIDAWNHPSQAKKWRQRIAGEKSKATSKKSVGS